ncbi:MAG: hypothetical protein L6R38_006760 [Xanthoria sp. 2 TBL-2021]|nr:MAG: hypothetical protein L6R38_006760 [Xanthoria sp. 2 TBL-2021]
MYRLLDPADSLCEHVRVLKVASHLLIDPSKGKHFRNQDTAHLSDLERIIMRLANLCSLSWDLNMDIPRPILSILEQQWSDVKLSVTNHDRLETKLPLLATPLLRSLRFNATPGPSGTYDKLDGYSKMPELREIMLNAPNLRKLDITFAPYWMNRNSYQHAEALRSFSRLVTARVNMNLNFDASDFVAEYHQDAQGTKPLPPLNIDIARKVTTKLFKGFFLYNPSARLEHLEICFKYTQQDDRGQTYPIDIVLKIRRDRSLGAKSPVDWGYVVEGNGKWRGGYQF